MNFLFGKTSARTLSKLSKLNSFAYLGFTLVVFISFIQPQSLSVGLFLLSALFFMLNNTLKNITYKKFLKEENTKSLNFLLDRIANQPKEK